MDTDDDDTQDPEKAYNERDLQSMLDDDSFDAQSSLDSVSLFGSNYSYSTRRSKRSDRSSVTSSSRSRKSDGSSSRRNRRKNNSRNMSSLTELPTVDEEEHGSRNGSQASASQTLNSNSVVSESSFRNNAKTTGEQSTVSTDDEAAFLSQLQPSTSATSDRDQASAQSELTFISRLGRTVKLEAGGVRVSEQRVEKSKLEIIDRYPAPSSSKGKNRFSTKEELSLIHI